MYVFLFVYIYIYIAHTHTILHFVNFSGLWIIYLLPTHRILPSSAVIRHLRQIKDPQTVRRMEPNMHVPMASPLDAR